MIENNFESVVLLKETLEERQKELECLFKIDEAIANGENFVDILQDVSKIIPLGFQIPEIISVKILWNDILFGESDFIDYNVNIKADIKIQDKKIGEIIIFYRDQVEDGMENYFLPEEFRMIQSIANKLSIVPITKKFEGELAGSETRKWTIALDMFKNIDWKLLSLISRKMLNYMICRGYTEVSGLFYTINRQMSKQFERDIFETNTPLHKKFFSKTPQFSYEVFNLAARYLSDDEIFNLIQKWVIEDKLSYLVKTLDSYDRPHREIYEALNKYYELSRDSMHFSIATDTGVRVSLIRRFLSDQLEYLNVAKQFIEIEDFHKILPKSISPRDSQGRLGGKFAGLFIAYKILEKEAETHPELKDIKMPKTWTITSDGVIKFMYYNNLEDVVEQKYKTIDEIRQEYPYVVQAFKNAQFQPEIIKGLARALDDFGDAPIVVRSSSLLEDRIGAAFSGKYKSLFLANQGSKEERLEALLDAVAEVYASTLGPDPIEYRSERGLLDFNEEMAIMIQEVVGVKVGKYHFPAFAGVAFSLNEFRWSPRISRHDGLARIVAGLGTRAVDRVGEDYPVLVAPGMPNLRVNQTPNEIMQYSPKKIDVIDLETKTFETVEINDILDKNIDAYPAINKIFTIIEDNNKRIPMGIYHNEYKDSLYVTFEGLFSNSGFLKKIKKMLDVLSEKLNSPVDIEFASKGDDLYILQCRPQSSAGNYASSEIPQNVPYERILFTANQFVTNGKTPDIDYIVYVDPEEYANCPDLNILKTIGRVVGRLNKALPKGKFILIGPGRWGSRGDIKLGVNVTYSDINNTSVLIEVAKKKGGYMPDLSFGTHFFQDLVEAQIHYLPLYPDQEGIIYNEEFLNNSKNYLADFAHEFVDYANIVKLIDVKAETKGLTLKILFNADQDKAIAFLTSESGENFTPKSFSKDSKLNENIEWRKEAIEKIISEMPAKLFGVQDVYLIDNFEEAKKDPNKPISIIVDCEGDQTQKDKLELWLSVWNMALSELYSMKTSIRINKILDYKFYSNKDFDKMSSLAYKIGELDKNAKKMKIS